MSVQIHVYTNVEVKSVSGERMCTILVNCFNRGLSLPSKCVVRLTDRPQHYPIGLTGS